MVWHLAMFTCVQQFTVLLEADCRVEILQSIELLSYSSANPKIPYLRRRPYGRLPRHRTQKTKRLVLEKTSNNESGQGSLKDVNGKIGLKFWLFVRCQRQSQQAMCSLSNCCSAGLV